MWPDWLNNAVKSVAAWAGNVLSSSSSARKEYSNRASKLTEITPENRIARANLKQEIRKKTPEPIRSFIEKARPMDKETSKAVNAEVNNPSKTNEAVNKLGENFGHLGTGITVVSVAI